MSGVLVVGDILRGSLWLIELLAKLNLGMVVVSMKMVMCPQALGVLHSTFLILPIVYHRTLSNAQAVMKSHALYYDRLDFN
mgnify:CR=1 FL=1